MALHAPRVWILRFVGSGGSDEERSWSPRERILFGTLSGWSHSDVKALLRCPCGGTLRMVALVTELKPVRDILVAMGLDPIPPARAPPRQADFGWHEPA